MNTAHAFTLNNNFGAAFKKNKVKVFIAGDTICDKIGVTVYDLQDMISPSVDDFWNRVPTSALRLKNAGFSDPIGNNINTDRLCAPTDDECITTASVPVIPPVSDILIACNSHADNFNNSTSILAVTVPNNFSGRKIAGAVILLNNMNGTAFAGLSRSEKISVLAHEIGHAIGLGHAEDNQSEALMYYKTVEKRSSLAQDDVDGVSYLYPKHVDGCGLFGTIDTNRKGPPFWQMGVSLAVIIAVFELLRLLKRPKACATA